MLNNDILRRIRFTLDLADPKMIAIIAGGGRDITREQLRSHYKKEDEDGMQPCPDDVMAAFLNGLIIERRGARDERPPVEDKIDNNLVMKKLRIAFSLRGEDIQDLLASSKMKITRSEVNALFRQPGHKNFKTCGDQVLRNLLAGLTRQYRPDQA